MTLTDDLEDLPERFRLLAHLEAKFGPGYNDMLAEKGYDRQFVRAYLACVTFADEQLGRILDAWDASPHARNGYIVLWSDHGYNLGDGKPVREKAVATLNMSQEAVAELSDHELLDPRQHAVEFAGQLVEFVAASTGGDPPGEVARHDFARGPADRVDPP